MKGNGVTEVTYTSTFYIQNINVKYFKFDYSKKILQSFFIIETVHSFKALVWFFTIAIYFIQTKMYLINPLLLLIIDKFIQMPIHKIMLVYLVYNSLGGHIIYHLFPTSP